jgi:hypothetical protein
MTMRRLFSVLIIVGLPLIVARETLAGLDYVYLSSHQFGTMDLQTGSFSVLGTTSITYEDLTRLPGGTLYATDDSSRLLIIDQNTGAISSVVGTMGNGIEGAKFSGSGILFGYNRNDLYIIDPTTAQSTLVGSFGITAGADYNATFNGNTMYLQETNGPGGTSTLYTVNTSTGVATTVGNIGYGVLATDFENGTLYGFTTSGQIISINTGTGAGTFVANQSSGDVFSAATAGAGAVPEPASLTMMNGGLAMVALVALARRRGRFA